MKPLPPPNPAHLRVLQPGEYRGNSGVASYRKYKHKRKTK